MHTIVATTGYSVSGRIITTHLFVFLAAFPILSPKAKLFTPHFLFFPRAVIAGCATFSLT
jgi:hypothetical protein